MKRILLILCLFVFLAPFCAAAQAGDYVVVDTKTPLTVEQFKALLPEKDSPELDLAGLIALKESGRPMTVLDLRSKENFTRKRLKGSVNLPLTDLTGENLAVLAPDKDAPIVLACDYSFQPVRLIAMTMQAYPVLKAHGYKNIYRLNLWQSADKGKIILMEDIEKALPFEGAGAEVSPAPEPEMPSVMCTMDAKECPDGSYVSRTGPNCEFAECPSPK